MLARILGFMTLCLFVVSCSPAEQESVNFNALEKRVVSPDEIAEAQTESNVVNEAHPKSAAQWLGDYASVRILREQAGLYVEEESYFQAAQLYEKAAKLGESFPSSSSRTLLLSAAEHYVKASENALALKALQEAAEKGARWSDYVEFSAKYSDLRDEEAFQSIISKLENNRDIFEKRYQDPEKTPLIFSDVKRFWKAYDLALNEESDEKKAAIFRHFYLAEGSPGLIDYHWIKTGTAEELVKRINEIPGFYDGIRDRTLTAESYGVDIRAGFRRFKAIYPEAYFPPVTFVIGRLNSGGTAGEEGMLIGLDVWSWTEGVPLDGISTGFQKVLQSFSLESLPWVVVHEQVHAMQSYSGEPSLLLSVLQEGSADFLAKLALPEQSNPPHYEWGLQHETRIWARFVEEMDGNDLSNWIGNNSSNIAADWHADVGYFLGARIAEAYYKQAEDKEQAVRDLLYVNNPHDVLVASGYAEKFR